MQNDMKSSTLSRSVLIFVLMLSTGILFAQSQQVSTGFVPEVGQEGKDVVWVPTPQELVDKMLEIAKVTPEDFLIDLGSGDGRTVISAAKLGVRARGIEYNPDMVKLSKKNAELAGVSSMTEFLEQDLFQTDLSKATVITMFLLPEINLKLRPTLLDLKPGTRIVSNTFTMSDWEPDYEVTTEENWNSWNNALLWIVPAKVEGKWKTGKGELNITQNFQFIHGTMTLNGKSSTISDGRLNGSEITFTVDGAIYKGKVEGNKMNGTSTSAGNKQDWMAAR